MGSIQCDDHEEGPLILGVLMDHFPYSSFLPILAGFIRKR